MTNIEFSSEMGVSLIDNMGDDATIIRAAKVSTLTDEVDTSKPEKFIDFLVANRHMSPFEHCATTFVVDAPIFVWREFMRHRTFCVSGDTVITFCSPDGKEKRYQTIAEYFEHRKVGTPDNRYRTGGKIRYRKRTNDYVFDYTDVDDNDKRTTQTLGPWTSESEAKAAVEEFRRTPRRRRILPSVLKKKALSVNEETGEVEANTVVDVFESGIKGVYEVVTEQGDMIKTTLEHRFRTDEGYKKLSELSVGDAVQVYGLRGVSGRDPLVSKELRAGIGHWVQVIRQTKYSKAETYSCYMCGKDVSWSEMELDHMIPVVKDLSLALTESNLAPACKGCHKKKTRSEQVYRSRGRTRDAGVKSAIIESITYVGEEMTYDLSMEAPNNNFIGNNFVVHNSYNEQSGRYTEMRPRFYTPDTDRKLVQVGKTGEYKFEDGDPLQAAKVSYAIDFVSRHAWDQYTYMLDQGIAKEVARMVLPVNIYSRAYVTGKLRNWLQFLSLRTTSDRAEYPSYPQREIEMVAEQIEGLLTDMYPNVMRSWNEHGRVGL